MSSSPATLMPEDDVRRVTLRSSVFSMLSAFGAASPSPFLSPPGSAFSSTCVAVIFP
jgi:hypothetical protein